VQHAECTLRVEVAEESRSGEHKVKIIGVVVSEEAGLSKALVTGIGGFGGER
jgi:hypothetical protein